MEQRDKRDAVMLAAMELVGERGFHGSPMADIAQRAGVAAGTIYRYFESKDALIKGVHASLEEQILAAVAEGYPAEQPARERFLHVARRLVAYFIASPLQFRFMEQFHDSPYGVEHRREKLFGRKDRNIIGELFEDARAAGVVKDLPLPVLLSLTFGPLASVCRDHILGFVTLDARLIERTTESCWDAIRVHHDTAGGGNGRP